MRACCLRVPPLPVPSSLLPRALPPLASAPLSQPPSPCGSPRPLPPSPPRLLSPRYGMSELVGKVSLDYDDNGRSMSSETRAAVEKEVKALLQVRVEGRGRGGG